MTSKYLEKKSVLITGCTTGSIGHALALEFHSKGFHVIATSRHLASMPDLNKHSLIDTVQLDVCSQDSILKARAEIENLTDGKLDFLVNNAGGAVSNFTPASEIDVEQAQQEFQLNFWGAVRMVEAFTPLLVRSSSGHIVNISSTVSTIPLPYISMYGAAKTALNYYGDVLRIELMPLNVSVTTVMTGATTNSKNSDKSTSKEAVLEVRPGSMYTPALQAHRDAFQKEVAQARTASEDYARQLVREVTRRKPSKYLYIGSRSTLAWVMQTFFPRWLVDTVMYDMWGLKAVAEGRGKKTT